MGYKFSLLSTAALSRRIEKRADVLEKSIDLAGRVYDKLAEQFKQLKRVKPKLSKLAVQAATFKKEKPVLQDLYKKNEKKVHGIEKLIVSDIEKMLGLIDKIALLMKNITFDADTILYCENKKFSYLVKKTRRIHDSDVVNRIVFRLNTLKAEMKSLTLRLLQASELGEEEVLRYPAKIQEIQVASVKRFGKRIAELEGVGIKRIDAVIKKGKAKLKNLRSIEMRIIFLMSSVDRYLDLLKNRTYLFSGHIRAGVEKRISASIKKFSDVKKDIREQALKLYEDIEIIGEKL